MPEVEALVAALEEVETVEDTAEDTAEGLAADANDEV
jgi:hypothetical protein